MADTIFEKEVKDRIRRQWPRAQKLDGAHIHQMLMLMRRGPGQQNTMIYACTPKSPHLPAPAFMGVVVWIFQELLSQIICNLLFDRMDTKHIRDLTFIFFQEFKVMLYSLGKASTVMNVSFCLSSIILSWFDTADTFEFTLRPFDNRELKDLGHSRKCVSVFSALFLHRSKVLWRLFTPFFFFFLSFFLRRLDRFLKASSKLCNWVHVQKRDLISCENFVALPLLSSVRSAELFRKLWLWRITNLFLKGPSAGSSGLTSPIPRVLLSSPSRHHLRPGQTGSVPPFILVPPFNLSLLFMQKNKVYQAWCCHGSHGAACGPLVDLSSKLGKKS